MASKKRKHRHQKRNKAQASPPGDHHAAFPFCKLPPELRNLIYDLIFAIKKDASKSEERIDISSKSGVPHALARTCRALRAETLPVFLQNKFTISITRFDTTTIDKWFSLYSDYGVGAVDLQINWFPSLPATRGTRRKFLTLPKPGFDQNSHVWLRPGHREWVCTELCPSQRAELQRALLRFDEMKQIVHVVEQIRRKGVVWKDMRLAVEAAVETSNMFRSVIGWTRLDEVLAEIEGAPFGIHDPLHEAGEPASFLGVAG